MKLLKIIIPVLTLAGPAITQANSQGLADPMRPSGNIAAEHRGEKTPLVKGWHLASTLIADGRKVASLNNRLVSEGDVISGARVLNISNGEIRLEYQDKIMIVKLHTQTIRK